MNDYLLTMVQLLKKLGLIILSLIFASTFFGCDGSKDDTSDIIEKLRDNFKIAQEATDSELQAFLEDEPNRVFIETIIKQITFGQRVKDSSGTRGIERYEAEKELRAYLSVMDR